MADKFPLHVVVTWIGNSERIAAKHYWQVREEHYKQALGMPVKRGAKCSATSMQEWRAMPRNRSMRKTMTEFR